MDTALVCGRIVTAPQGDSFVQCSFDRNHVILRSKMAKHIVKCVNNHPRHNKIQCPFDATEYIDPEKFAQHLVTCDSRRSLVAHKYDLVNLKALDSVGKLDNISVSQQFEHIIEEDWDEPSYKNTFESTDEDENLLEIDELVGQQNMEGENSSQSFKPIHGLGRAAFISKVYRDYLENKKLRINRSSSSNSEENVPIENFEDA